MESKKIVSTAIGIAVLFGTVWLVSRAWKAGQKQFTMNWKKAGGILITLGVTATAIYMSYSFVFLAKKKDFDLFKEKCKDSVFFKDIDSVKEGLMIKNIHNLSKKQLIKFSDLCNKGILTEEEKKEFDKLKKKWKYEL